MDLAWDLEAASQMSQVASEAASQSMYYVASMAASFVNTESTKDGFPETELPVWIMGKSYSAIYDLDELNDEVFSRLWFSYRKDFPEIGQSGLTSDRGWGCMLRCGQMVIAECLQRLSFGRDFRWTRDLETKLPEDYFEILEKFSDSKTSAYSIHQIALMGESSENRPVGTWFGPNAVAQTLKKLSVFDDSKFGLNVHVALDNLVVIDIIKREPWKPLLLFIPLRLGISEINPLYFTDVKQCFEFEECVGIIGGRPNHALFFIGYVGDELLCLDPHVTQTSCNVQTTRVLEADLECDVTFHSEKCHRINLQHLDPSLSLCFFCKTEADFDSLCLSLSARLIRGHSTPMFEIRQSTPTYQEQCGQPSTDDNDQVSPAPSGSDEEEFEMI